MYKTYIHVFTVSKGNVSITHSILLNDFINKTLKTTIKAMENRNK